MSKIRISGMRGLLGGVTDPSALPICRSEPNHAVDDGGDRRMFGAGNHSLSGFGSVPGEVHGNDVLEGGEGTDSAGDERCNNTLCADQGYLARIAASDVIRRAA